MNPPPHGWPTLATNHPLHARPAPLAPSPARLPMPQSQPQAQLPSTTAPARSEMDVQWIVGWLRDLLVIAMAITNLLHAGGGH